MVPHAAAVANLNGIAERISRIVVGSPVALAGGVLVFLALALFGGTKLEFDDGTRSIFSSSRAEFAAYSAHVEEFAQTDTVAIVLVESENPFAAAQWSWMRDAVAAAQNVEGVETVFSVFGVNMFHPEAGDVSAMSEGELARLPNLQPGGPSVRNYGTADRSLLSENRRSTVIVVALRDELQDLTIARPTLDRLRTIMADSGDAGLETRLTGMVPIRQWIIDGIVRDQIAINLAAAAIGFLISLILFRSLWIAVLNGVAPVLALIFSLGAFGLFGFEINTVRNALPVLILVLAMADCIHMTFEFCETYAKTGDREESLRRMVRHMAPPCVLTSLTTIIAFAGLYYSESPLIQSLSLSGMLAVAIALLVVLFVHPLVFLLALRYGPVQRALGRSRRGIIGGLPLKRLFSAIIARPRSIALGGSALAIALLFLFLPIKTDFRFYEYVEEDAEIVRALDRAEAVAGPTQSIDIPLRAEGPLSTGILDEAREVHRRLAEAFPDNPVVSVSTVADALEARDEWPSWNNVQLALAPLPAFVSDSLVSRNGDAVLVRVMTSDDNAGDVRNLVAEIDELTSSLDTQSVSAERATGLTALAANLSDTMIWQLTISFLIAALLCPIVIGLWFRSWRFAVAAVLPNMLPILAVGAWLGWTGWNLQFTSALALAIAFGIAVDDTVHVLNRYRIERDELGAGEPPGSLVAAMNRVAPALIATTLILIAGLLSTLFSTMPTARFFGEICIAVFMLALVADLFLLPALLALFGRNKAKRLPIG